MKFSIVKMESRRQRLISSTFDRYGGRIEAGAVPDVYGPLRDLVTTLLPHLRFVGVDTSNENDQRCIFEKLDAQVPVKIDIDDLSSGEKAVIALFLPFIEAQIERLLDDSQSTTAATAPMSVAIIDEPELHLHPALQTAMIAYIRQLAQQNAAQFILATHSTTLMDALEDDELYVLAPPIMVGDGNQLTKLSATAERLEVVREITGSTYVVTRCRPIVFLEGERPGTKVMSDQRILEMLVPEAKGWVPVPSGGRSQAIKAATDLRNPSLTELPGLPVFALVDRDQSAGTEADYVITWPVCMIENLLLDPDAIWSLLEPMKENVRLTSAANVTAILRQYCEENRDREIRLRVRRRIEQPRWNLAVERPDDALMLVTAAGDAATAYLGRIGGETAVTAAVATAERDVDEILRSGQHLELFHGKDILQRFFREYANRAGWGHTVFAYQLAQKVTETSRLRRLVNVPARKIRQYIPCELVSHLLDACSVLSEQPQLSDAEQAQASATLSRTAWEMGDEDQQDRLRMRQQVVVVGRGVREMGLSWPLSTSARRYAAR